MSTNSFTDYALDQMRALDVRARAMFGGFGLYHGEVFFGVVAEDRLYFKTDDESRVEYERQGMEPFRPSEKQTLSSYYEVPADVLEDDEKLTTWALRAVEAQG